MHIKKTHSQNGKKYNVIIRAEENIVEDKGYLTFFKEVKMSNKAPVWFVEFANKQEQFNKEMIEFKTEVISRLDNLEKCPTIKAELQQTN